MRPSHLVIDGGEPPLLKITVWLGNKAADKYRLATLFGRADVGKIPHGHRWDLPRSEFAPDSPLEGDGFEPSVPQQIRSPVRDSSPVSLASQNRNVRSMTDRKPCMAIARFIASKCARLPRLIEPRVMPRPVSNKGFRSRRLAPKNEPRQGG